MKVGCVCGVCVEATACTFSSMRVGLFHVVELQHKAFTTACSPVQMARTQNHLPTLKFEAAIFDPRCWGRMFFSKSGKTGRLNVYFAKNGRSQFNGRNSLFLEVQLFWRVRSCRLLMTSRHVGGT